LPSAAPTWTPSWKVRIIIVADLDRRIAQIDAAMGKATAKAGTTPQCTLPLTSAATWPRSPRDQANKTFAELKIKRAKVDGDKKVADADLGRCDISRKSIAAGSQDVLRWLVILSWPAYWILPQFCSFWPLEA
jgi:hypothetical protein